MKKVTLFLSIAAFSLPMFADDVVLEIDGVTVLKDSYAHRISADGTKIVGETAGGTTYYDRTTGETFFYGGVDFGRGNVVSNDGWVVGCEPVDDDFTKAAVMVGKEVIYPTVFDPRVASNLHAITPDGTRVCGVIGNNGKGLTNFPIYCDIDADGNFSEVHILPYPEKDLFEMTPQMVTATWISDDGNTIAGQVVDYRGMFVYPILFTCDASGEWTPSYPAYSLFNPNKIPIPKPLGEFEDEYPDVIVPDLQNYMDEGEWEFFQEAVQDWLATGGGEENSPYNELYLYMDPDKYEQYRQDCLIYDAAAKEFNEAMAKYWDDLYEIGDTSVFFVRNSMALSPDGKWLAASAQVEDLSDPDDPVGYYIPYLMNLVTGDAKQIGPDYFNLLTNQVFPDGTVFANTPPDDVVPARSWVYAPRQDKMTDFIEYIKPISQTYYDWLIENVTGEVPVAIDPNGSYVFETFTISGKVSASADRSVMVGGVDGYAIGADMYLTYIFTDLEDAGVESLTASDDFDGVYRVFNLQGVKVAETKDVNSLNSIAKGIYIINGKKVVIK